MREEGATLEHHRVAQVATSGRRGVLAGGYAQRCNGHPWTAYAGSPFASFAVLDGRLRIRCESWPESISRQIMASWIWKSARFLMHNSARAKCVVAFAEMLQRGAVSRPVRVKSGRAGAKRAGALNWAKVFLEWPELCSRDYSNYENRKSLHDDAHAVPPELGVILG